MPVNITLQMRPSSSRQFLDPECRLSLTDFFFESCVSALKSPEALQIQDGRVNGDGCLRGLDPKHILP